VIDNERRVALDRFYGELATLEIALGGKRELRECHGKMEWPQRGVYFFFEEGEFRNDGVTPRVVRVGTHALRPSSSTLWGRLAAHKGSSGGSMPGGGNHRGSIFRLHVGTALLTQGTWSDDVRTTWGVGSSAKGSIRMSEFSLEKDVSRSIGAMPFLWLDVNDDPSAQSNRGVIERGAISLLSNFLRSPIDGSSTSWLGRNTERNTIRSSWLWNVNHVADEPNPSFLVELSRYVKAANI
jgi:hypothetical protein